jgi:hypothetical protein
MIGLKSKLPDRPSDTVILAVSTTGINPLQAVKTLHSRQSQLPSWVDPTHLRYTLIVHPRNSQLSDEVYVGRNKKE